MVKKLRIAHVTATFPPYQGGTGNVCYYNARELARLGHEVHVFTAACQGAPAIESKDSFTIHRLKPIIKVGNAFLLPSLATLLRPFDLVHLHMPFFGAAEFILLLRGLTRIPLVVTYHQDVILNGLTGIISRVYDRLIARRLMLAADRVCFTSMDYARHSKYASLLEQGRITGTELPNGVDSTRFTPDGRPARLIANYGLHGQKILLFVGALDKAHFFKGIPNLLQALAQIDRPDVSLIVIGSGDLQNDYRQLALKLAVAERVVFAGYVPDQDLPDHYRLSDMTVLPSTTAGEAFGLVLLESLACGTPVIATNLPGVRTVVHDGKDGLLCEPENISDLGDKVQIMLDLPEVKRQAMGQAGRQKVTDNYDWQPIGRRLENIYSEVKADFQRARYSKEEARIAP